MVWIPNENSIFRVVNGRTHYSARWLCIVHTFDQVGMITGAQHRIEQQSFGTIQMFRTSLDAPDKLSTGTVDFQFDKRIGRTLETVDVTIEITLLSRLIEQKRWITVATPWNAIGVTVEKCIASGHVPNEKSILAIVAQKSWPLMCLIV